MKDWQKVVFLWDVYPKFCLKGETTTVTVRPMGHQSDFPRGSFRVLVSPMHGKTYPRDDTPRNVGVYTLAAEDDGSLKITHCFDAEQEYSFSYMKDDKWIPVGSVYCLEKDLYSLLPLSGDQHIHTIRSDGKCDPAYTAAASRAQGYDYVVITDHRNMIGSLEAMDAYKGIPMDFNMMQGEEVHMPDAEIHVINFGGKWSINAMAARNVATMKAKNDPVCMEKHQDVWMKMDSNDYPEPVSDEDFCAMIREYGKDVEVPEGLPRHVYLTFKWVCEEIRRAGGLSIFAHPFWITRMAYHVDERLTEYIFEQQDFDAYEVLGGELYFEQNGLQTVHYYDQVARGRHLCIVGGSDTHDVVAQTRTDAGFCASTIVFAKANTQEAIFEAIRAGLSVAVDWISPEEPRLVGPYRLVKIAQFLMNYYFPLHDPVCEAEAQAMMDYVFRDRDGGERVLRASYGRIPAMWKKYFPGNS